MPSFRTPALVLRSYKFSEADRIVVLFTRAFGKVRAVAKGVSRARSRLRGCLGWLSLSELQLHGREHQDLYLVTQGQLLGSYARLKEDLQAIGRGARMAELVMQLTPDHHPQADIFDLLRRGLEWLDAGLPQAEVGAWFDVSLLDRLGYRPHLTSCQRCGTDRARMAYHPESGGVVCRECQGQGGFDVSPGTRRLLQSWLAGAGAEPGRVRLPASLEREVAELLDAALHHQLGRRLKSDTFRHAMARVK